MLVMCVVVIATAFVSVPMDLSTLDLLRAHVIGKNASLALHPAQVHIVVVTSRFHDVTFGLNTLGADSGRVWCLLPYGWTSDRG
jgi:hypothetical protein